MELNHAVDLIAEADDRDREERAARLVELTGLLRDEPQGFTGQAAAWLFDDVKATWIYGYFTSTVLTAHAFCIQQLAGVNRLLSKELADPLQLISLDKLAELSGGRGLIGLDLRARLVTLHDSANLYLSANIYEYRPDLEQRIADAQSFTEDHTLLIDARVSLECSVALLLNRL